MSHTAEKDAGRDWAVHYACLRCEYVTAAWWPESPGLAEEMRQHMRDRHPHVFAPGEGDAR